MGTGENDLKVASELGEIRATLKAMDLRLADFIDSMIDKFDGKNHQIETLDVRLSQVEKAIINFKTQMAGVAIGISLFGTVGGWLVLNWGAIVKVFS